MHTLQLKGVAVTNDWKTCGDKHYSQVGSWTIWCGSPMEIPIVVVEPVSHPFPVFPCLAPKILGLQGRC